VAESDRIAGGLAAAAAPLADDQAPLDEREAEALSELMAVIAEREPSSALPIDKSKLIDAYRFAGHLHRDQRRRSGEEFISHPVSVATICAGLGLDTETLAAALLHDTIEDTAASLDQIEQRFGTEIASLVDGVTKLDALAFKSRNEAQAENYRKMVVAMATDIRVILLKLADRLHNMRTISAMPKQKQVEKARETLEIYAPIAHRLGIHAIKWELEDLAFAALHPRKFNEIKGLVNQQREAREQYVASAGEQLLSELQQLGIEADISGRAKHFYSIYSKMTKKDREFNEIYDLTAMRVTVESVKDCYGAVGVIHSLWKPLPGRFKDMIAMPKANRYQSLHTTVIGPEGLPLEIQIRTREMHETAEFGVAAHWSYKDRLAGAAPGTPASETKLTWLRSMLEWQQELADPDEFVGSLKDELDEEEDEVFVFTPEGEVRSLAAGATPLDFAYEIHTELGHRCVGAKVNGKLVPLGYELRSGDRVEVLTGRRERGPSRDWLATVTTTRARKKITQWFSAESRDDAERNGREMLQAQLRSADLPVQKITGSPLLAAVIREMGFRKTEDFYVALGGSKISAKVVVAKIITQLGQGKTAAPEPTAGDVLEADRPGPRMPSGTSAELGIKVKGADRVMLRLAKCCHPVPGDGIVGYVSLGRGITIHRDDCRNVASLRKDAARFVDVRWDGDNQTGFLAEIHVDAWDRTRLLEYLTRTIGEQGASIVEARCLDHRPMVANRFVIEVADTKVLKATVNRLRAVESVFDAYRVTPGT
jgi:GTP pyrophosphokinase